MGAGEGFEDVAHVGEAHGGNVFQEGYVGDEFGVGGGTLPFGKDDGIVGLEGGVGSVRVEEDSTGERSVNVVEILKEEVLD